MSLSPTSADGSEIGGTYDPLSPDSIVNDLPAAGADSSVGLSYNAASQITRRVQANDSYAAPPAYNVSRPYVVNGLNQYKTAGTASFAYDPNGNLVSAANPPSGTTGYVYDVENRMVTASTGAALVYDPLGRLVQAGVRAQPGEPFKSVPKPSRV